MTHGEHTTTVTLHRGELPLTVDVDLRYEDGGWDARAGDAWTDSGREVELTNAEQAQAEYDARVRCGQGEP